jgi:excinuclease ABC subunit B
VTTVRVGEKISRNAFLHKLVDAMYSRTDVLFQRGNFRVKGDTVDVFPAYADEAVRIVFFGDEIEEIATFDPDSGYAIRDEQMVVIYPATIFVTTKDVYRLPFVISRMI